jgi:hypothetical protein
MGAYFGGFADIARKEGFKGIQTVKTAAPPISGICLAPFANLRSNFGMAARTGMRIYRGRWPIALSPRIDFDPLSVLLFSQSTTTCNSIERPPTI